MQTVPTKETIENNVGEQQKSKNTRISKLTKLSDTYFGDYTLWKTTQNLKRPKNAVPLIKVRDGTLAKNSSGEASAFVKPLSQEILPKQEKPTYQILHISHRLGNRF